MTRIIRTGPCVSCGQHRELSEQCKCARCLRIETQARKRDSERARIDGPQVEALEEREALAALNAAVRRNRQALKNSH